MDHWGNPFGSERFGSYAELRLEQAVGKSDARQEIFSTPAKMRILKTKA
jgi:hypothetical protein